MKTSFGSSILPLQRDLVKLTESNVFFTEGNSTETKLELASVSPQKPMEATAKEQLENGDMSGDGGY